VSVSRRRRYTRSKREWSSDLCSSDLYKNVVVIGGKRALKSVSEKIKEALKDTEINITNEFVYGDECTMTNINNLSDKKDVQDAEIGRASCRERVKSTNVEMSIK